MTPQELAQRVASKTVAADLVDATAHYFEPDTKVELDHRADGCHFFQEFPRDNEEALYDIAFKNNKHSDFLIVWPTQESTAAVLLTFKQDDQNPTVYGEPWKPGLNLAMCRHGYAVVIRQQGGVAKVTRPYDNRSYLMLQQGGVLDLPADQKAAEEAAIGAARTRVDEVWAEITELFNSEFVQALEQPYVREEWFESVRERWEILGFLPLADGPPSAQSMATMCQDSAHSIAIPVGLRWVLAREKDTDSRGQLMAVALWNRRQGALLCHPNSDPRAGHGFWVLYRGDENLTEERRLFVTLRGQVVMQEPVIQLDLESINEQRRGDSSSNLPQLESYEQMAEEAEQNDLMISSEGETNTMA
jgi:hypothetical protein